MRRPFFSRLIISFTASWWVNFKISAFPRIEESAQIRREQAVSKLREEILRKQIENMKLEKQLQERKEEHRAFHDLLKHQKQLAGEYPENSDTNAASNTHETKSVLTMDEGEPLAGKGEGEVSQSGISTVNENNIAVSNSNHFNPRWNHTLELLDSCSNFMPVFQNNNEDQWRNFWKIRGSNLRTNLLLLYIWGNLESAALKKIYNSFTGKEHFWKQKTRLVQVHFRKPLKVRICNMLMNMQFWKISWNTLRAFTIIIFCAL